MSKQQDFFQTATTLPQQLIQTNDNFSEQITNRNQKNFYSQTYDLHRYSKDQSNIKISNRTRQLLKNNQQNQNNRQLNKNVTLHHDPFKITKEGIKKIQDQNQDNQNQEKLMYQVLQQNESIKLPNLAKKNEYFKQQPVHQVIKDKKLRSLQLQKQQKQPQQQTILPNEQNNLSLLSKLTEKCRLQQTLNNIHIFYGIRIKQLKQQKVANDFLFINLLHQIEDTHQNKVFLLKSCLDSQKKNKLIISQSQKHLSNLSSSMEKAIQASIQQKQKNQSLNQNLRLKQISIYKKKIILQNLKKELLKKQQVFSKFKDEQKNFKKTEKSINALLSKQYIKAKIPQLEQ